MLDTENQTYRRLIEGETILASDETYHDETDTWQPVANSVGQKAPSPLYTSHRKFRRKVEQQVSTQQKT